MNDNFHRGGAEDAETLFFKNQERPIFENPASSGTCGTRGTLVIAKRQFVFSLAVSPAKKKLVFSVYFVSVVKKFRL